MMNLILDKTDKGREEITTRKYHLSSKLRGRCCLSTESIPEKAC